MMKSRSNTSVLRMVGSRVAKTTVFRLIVFLFFVALYCEKIHYYVVLLHCTWPSLDHESRLLTADSHDDLKVMFLADTHLLGFRDGHWFDKLRREWQMTQAFQAAMLIHKPEIVFVLGDLLDEGKWCDDEEFLYHSSRFWSMFAVPRGTDLYAVAGNHDEGFHYMMTSKKHRRFEQQFESPSVQLVTKKSSTFVLINSMAMEGDGCSICAAAEREIRNISAFLTHLQNCEKNDEQNLSNSCHDYNVPYSQPILLQHFPMYRPSDADCHTKDSAPDNERYLPFREKFDCLDKRSTNLLMSMLNPRLVVNGHTHHGCFRTLPGGVPEWTVSSFSWRNRNNPTFLMGRFTRSKQSLSQCFMPEESTVINIYILAVVLVVLYILLRLVMNKYGSRQKTI